MEPRVRYGPTGSATQRQPGWAGGWVWPVGNGLPLRVGSSALSSQSGQRPGSSGSHWSIAAGPLVNLALVPRLGGRGAAWATVLTELMPAIDACLARGSSASARVTFAAAIDEGQVLVRIRGSEGSRNECIVNASGRVSVFEPLSDVDRRAGEGDPEFVRGESQPRGGNCRSVEAVTQRIPPASEGDEEQMLHLGWLVRRTC